MKTFWGDVEILRVQISWGMLLFETWEYLVGRGMVVESKTARRTRTIVLAVELSSVWRMTQPREMLPQMASFGLLKMLVHLQGWSQPEILAILPSRIFAVTTLLQRQARKSTYYRLSKKVISFIKYRLDVLSMNENKQQTVKKKRR